MESYQNEIAAVRERWKSMDFFEVMTSGSTGHPKTIRHSKSSLYKSAELTIDRFGLKENDQFLVCLPVKFIAGMMMVIRSEVANASLVSIPPSVNPLQSLDQAIDFAALTPLQLGQAMNLCPNKIKLIDKLIIGGAPISQKLLNQIQSFKSPTKFYHTYGMTETITHIAIKNLNKDLYNGYYEALTGIELSQTEDERLIISAAHLAESPIVTNDIVELIDDYRFLWLERSDNVINSGGLKIFPFKLENHLANQIGYEFFITSIPDEQLGHQLIMIIQDSNGEVDIELLRRKIKAQLPSNQAPKRIIKVKKLVKTATGKIIRDLNKYDIINY